MIVDLIGWLGTTLIMLGYYFNAKKYKACFYVWGLGNIVFLVYSYLINAIPQVAVSNRARKSFCLAYVNAVTKEEK